MPMIYPFFIVVLGGGTFTKVLTMYQIYHTWIHLLPCSPLFLLDPIPGTVSTGVILHLHTVYTVFAPYSPSYSLAPPPPPPISTTPLQPPGRTCSVLLFSDFVEEKEKK
jgi:hypothetical protein